MPTTHALLKGRDIYLRIIIALALGCFLCMPFILEKIPNKKREVLCNWLGLFDKGAVVLFGDSLLAELPMMSHFGLAPVSNQALGGRLASESLISLSKCIDEQTRLVIILLGTNDLGKGRSVVEIALSLERLITDPHLNGVHVALCSILPASKDGHSQRSPVILADLNLRIKEICHRRGAFFLDLHRYFQDESGYLMDRYSRDGLHLNAQGKQLLAEKIGLFIDGLDVINN